MPKIRLTFLIRVKSVVWACRVLNQTTDAITKIIMGGGDLTDMRAVVSANKSQYECFQTHRITSSRPRSYRTINKYNQIRPLIPQDCRKALRMRVLPSDVIPECHRRCWLHQGTKDHSVKLEQHILSDLSRMYFFPCLNSVQISQ